MAVDTKLVSPDVIAQQQDDIGTFVCGRTERAEREKKEQEIEAGETLISPVQDLANEECSPKVIQIGFEVVSLNSRPKPDSLLVRPRSCFRVGLAGDRKVRGR